MTPGFTPEDKRWMRRALKLAARGYTAPNPMVGCVLVKNDQAVGEGYHRFAGAPHAETDALNKAGSNSEGASAYVTLEPCSHFGRPPTCSRALIAAGVTRVIAATLDPDPRVTGTGFAELKAAGVMVETGLLRHEAEDLNRAYFHYQQTGRPFVTLKAAMSLDGKTATKTGDSRWISSEASRRYVHKLRG